MAGTLSIATFSPSQSANLIDGTNYSVAKDWAPAVGGLASGLLGGYTPYSDVVERVPINVRGPNAGSVYTNVQTLARVVEASQRVTDGRSPATAGGVFIYKPTNSTISVSYRTFVIGYPDPTSPESALTTSGVFDDGGIYNFEEVVLSFRRRGAWYGGNEGISAIGNTTVTSSTVVTAAFTSAPTYASPLQVRIGQFQAGTNGTQVTALNTGYIVIASGTSDDRNLQVVDAQTTGTASGWTRVASTTSNSRSGSVLRYSTTGTTSSTSGTLTLPGFYALSTTRVALLVAARNNSTVASWQLSANLFYTGTAANGQYSSTVTTSPITITTSSTVPQIVVLPPVAVFCADALTLTAQASTVSGTSTLDIDYVAVVNMPDESGQIIRYDTATILPLVGQSTRIDLQWIPYQEVAPQLYVTTATTGTIRMSYAGNIAVHQSALSNGTVQIGWFATSGTNWRHTNNGGTVLNVQVIACTRYPVVLSPA